MVDEDVILRSELDRAVSNIMAQYAGREDQLPPRDVLERQVLERLILIKLQVARAQPDRHPRHRPGNRRRPSPPSPSRTASPPTSCASSSPRDGTSYDEFRNSMRDELLIQRLRQRFAQSRISGQRSRSRRRARAAAELGSTQYHLAHILVALPEGATPEQIATAQKKIEGVKALIDSGEMDFAAAAVRYSDSPNALEGGDLGWRGMDEIPPAFADLIRAMSPARSPRPIRGPSGFQLVQAGRGARRRAGRRRHGHRSTTRATSWSASTTTHPDDAGHGRRPRRCARASPAAPTSPRSPRKAPRTETRRRKGGDLGWFPPDQFGTDVRRTGRGARRRRASQPFRTEAGWHIVERLGTRQTDVGDENRRTQVRETIGRRKLEDEYNRFLREMRGEAFVECASAARPRRSRPRAPKPATPPANGG